MGVELICIDCGCTFIARRRSAYRCADCKYEALKRTRRESAARTRAIKKHGKLPWEPTKTINEILREMEAYNAEHKTHLSYGQYVAKFEGGKK